MAGCLISLGFLLFLLILAEASLYPTKPIRNTTYIAGQAGLVTWVEDGIKPLLATMGRMKIDLYAGKNTFLATVAKDIDPLALSTTIFMPSSIPAHYYLFNLRFRAASPATSSSVLSRPLPRPVLRVPSIVIYTADFNITPNPLSLQSVFPLHTSTLGKATRSSHSTTSSLSQITSVPTNVTPTPLFPPASRLTPSSTASTVGKGKSGAIGKGLKSRGVIQGAGMMWIEIGVKAVMGLVGPVHAHEWNSGEIKFQLVFIVGPTLIGLSMAM